MDEDEKREFIEDFILDGVLTISFNDVVDDLWSRGVEDDGNALAHELHRLIRGAKVEVKFD